MSLWTPDGEHRVEPTSDPLGDLSDEERAHFEQLSPEDQQRASEMIGQMREVRERVLSTPAATIVVNHAMGLYELAAIHLEAEQPRFDEAKVAIDALAGILDSVAERLSEDAGVLRNALAQIQLAYVQLRAAAGTDQTA